ncbi:MAG: Ldh family oxidoreductase [Pseudomonadota bacterium]
MVQVSLKQIESVTFQALRAHGADDFPATEVARAVAAAEAVGNKICGLYYLESYCLQLRSGRVNGRVNPVVNQPKTAIVNVDAQFGFAQPAFTKGLPSALAAAREAGVAALAVCHAHTCTALGYFTRQIALDGCVGIGFTNASPIVAAPGGRVRAIGTNPIAFSVPDGHGGVAMQFDQSTTTVALGKITMAKAAGEAIPAGWALDADGRPTTDPEAALKGSLVSTGGYKGWGFGLMAEVLSAGLTGSLLSKDIQPLKAPEGAPHDLGQYYLLIDPANAQGFFDRLRSLSDFVAQDPGARLPGQNTVSEDPITLDDGLWRNIQALSAAR